MNLITEVIYVNIKQVTFCDPIKNNIVNNGTFSRITYSTSEVACNGLHVKTKLLFTENEKHFDKYKCHFTPKPENAAIGKIEESILAEYCAGFQGGVLRKTPVHKLKEQFTAGNVKLMVDCPPVGNTEVIVKISGVWETETNYGLTYKLIVPEKII